MQKSYRSPQSSVGEGDGLGVGAGVGAGEGVGCGVALVGSLSTLVLLESVALSPPVKSAKIVAAHN